MATVSLELGDVIALVSGFLADHGLIGTLRCLEQETGISLPQPSEDLAFLREVILDGRWHDAELLLQAFAAQPGFDAAAGLYAIRKQRFLELFAGKGAGFVPGGEGGGGGGGGQSDSLVMTLVEALKALEPVAPSKDDFHALCYCLTLPSVNAHPAFAHWTVHLGRQEAFDAVAKHFTRCFPPLLRSPASAVEGGVAPPGQLIRLLAQAAGAQVTRRVVADPRLGAQLLAQQTPAGCRPASAGGRGAGSAASPQGASGSSDGRAMAAVLAHDVAEATGVSTAPLPFRPCSAAACGVQLDSSRAGVDAPADASTLLRIARMWCGAAAHVHPLAYPIPVTPLLQLERENAAAAAIGADATLMVTAGGDDGTLDVVAEDAEDDGLGTGAASSAVGDEDDADVTPVPVVHLDASANVSALLRASWQPSKSRLSQTLALLRRSATGGNLAATIAVGGGLAHMLASSSALRPRDDGDATLSAVDDSAAVRTGATSGSGALRRSQRPATAGAEHAASRPGTATSAMMRGSVDASSSAAPASTTRRGADKWLTQSASIGNESRSSDARSAVAGTPASTRQHAASSTRASVDRLASASGRMKMPAGASTSRPATAQALAATGRAEHAARPASASDSRLHADESSDVGLVYAHPGSPPTAGGELAVPMSPPKADFLHASSSTAATISQSNRSATAAASRLRTPPSAGAAARQQRGPLAGDLESKHDDITLEDRLLRSVRNLSALHAAPMQSSALSTTMRQSLVSSGHAAATPSAHAHTHARSARPVTATGGGAKPHVAGSSMLASYGTASGLPSALKGPPMNITAEASYFGTRGGVAAETGAEPLSLFPRASADGLAGTADRVSASDGSVTLTAAEVAAVRDLLRASVQLPSPPHKRRGEAAASVAHQMGGSPSATGDAARASAGGVAWSVPTSTSPLHAAAAALTAASEASPAFRMGRIRTLASPSSSQAAASAQDASPPSAATELASTSPADEDDLPAESSQAMHSDARDRLLAADHDVAAGMDTVPSPDEDEDDDDAALQPSGRTQSYLALAAAELMATSPVPTGQRPGPAAGTFASAARASGGTGGFATGVRDADWRSLTAGTSAADAMDAAGTTGSPVVAEHPATGVGASAADGREAGADAADAVAALVRRQPPTPGSVPGWLIGALQAMGASADLIGMGYTLPDAIPDVPLAPVAVYKCTQPIRSVCWDPCILRWNETRVDDGQVDAVTAPSPLLAVGTNNRELHMAALPDLSAADAAGAVDLPLQHTWRGLHQGSVYCSAWASLGDAGYGRSLIATGSNDMHVKVVEWRHASDDSANDDSSLGHAGAGGNALLTIATDASTIRDVCWVTQPHAASSDAALRSSAAQSDRMLLAAAGGGDFAVRLYDISARLGPGGSKASGGIDPVLLKLAGHTNIVHAVQQWGDDGRQLISASADGTCRLWDVRMGSTAAAVLPVATLLTASGTAAAAAGASAAGIELLSLCPRVISGTGPREVVIGTSDGRVAVLDMAASRLVAQTRAHKAEVRSVDALGPLVLSGGSEGAVAICALTSGATGAALTVSQRLVSHRDKVLCTRWHPHSPLVASSAADKTAIVWGQPASA